MSRRFMARRVIRLERATKEAPVRKRENWGGKAGMGVVVVVVEENGWEGLEEGIAGKNWRCWENDAMALLQVGWGNCAGSGVGFG